jgi:urocanate hydratase
LQVKTVKIKTEANEIGGKEINIEDWWINVAGKSWMTCQGNPACIIYAMRTGLGQIQVPINNNVLYGKINGLGFLIHECEIAN